MTLDTITVSLAQKSYPIHIGQGLLDEIGRFLTEVDFPKQVALVSNPIVAELYALHMVRRLSEQGFRPCLIVVPDGEDAKNLHVLQTIYDQLIENRFDRGCGLLAVGGGVIGDMAGFVAATFLRGIPYVQVPTTLLAQVDSSVGGKTAVNHHYGKNLIGAFYQPEMVVIDIETLSSLDSREISAGLAEVVKYGVIRDADFFSWLEQHRNLLSKRDPEALIYAIKKSCQIKADIVEVDEREGSVRAYLNFGHTFGHAIENLAGYGTWKHGEAVAVGMVVAAKIARLKNLCSEQDIERLEVLLQALGLPITPPQFAIDDYVAAIQRDKKVKQGTLTLVLNKSIGDVALVKVTDLKELFSNVLTLKGAP